ncbi:MAG: zinc ribbon domain-containing protein [Clostridiales bacterium]|nr:zinc ribbon domain-containing protein [Clostridiales bacterium]
MFCTNCGTQNPDEARFCSGCGCALHPDQAAGTQPATGVAPMSNGQEKKVEIKSPASAKTGMTLGIIALILAAVSTTAWMLTPIIGARSGIVSIVLSIPAIVLSAKGPNQFERDYREIAMQNIVYRDEYNNGKNAITAGFSLGMAAIMFGIGTVCFSIYAMVVWY